MVWNRGVRTEEGYKLIMWIYIFLFAGRKYWMGVPLRSRHSDFDWQILGGVTVVGSKQDKPDDDYGWPFFLLLFFACSLVTLWSLHVFMCGIFGRMGLSGWHCWARARKIRMINLYASLCCKRIMRCCLLFFWLTYWVTDWMLMG